MFAALLLTVTGALAFRALTRDDSDDARPVVITTGDAVAFTDPLADPRPAVAPFAGLTEAVVTVGGERLRVVIADEPAERQQGLRGRDSLGPYDAMLFVLPDDTTGEFVMGGVPVDLDIRWLDADGAVVGEARMAACPDGDDASCGRYRPDGPYRFALETIATAAPEG
jgi:uncharacterized membrane protein (UPF0127 family)